MLFILCDGFTCRGGKRISFYFVTESARREEQRAHDDDDGDIGQNVTRLIDETVQRHGLTFGGKFSESKDARNEVHCQPSHSRDDRAQSEFYLGISQRIGAREHARQTDGGKREGIVEQKLRGVQNIRILERL